MSAIFWKFWYCLVVSFCVLYAAGDIYAAHHSSSAWSAGWVLGIALVTASAIAAPEFVGFLKSGSRTHPHRDAANGRR